MVDGDDDGSSLINVVGKALGIILSEGRLLEKSVGLAVVVGLSVIDSLGTLLVVGVSDSMVVGCSLNASDGEKLGLLLR